MVFFLRTKTETAIGTTDLEYIGIKFNYCI